MMHAAPEVSVIVRSMARPSLEAALASIAAQDYSDMEVVVVAACGAAHPPLSDKCGAYPLRLITSVSGLKRPAAANVGLDNARGEWIIFLDDDDIFLPGHISSLMAARRDAPKAKLVHCYARAVLREGYAGVFGQPHATIQLFERNYIHLSAAVFSRQLLQNGCRFDESFDVMEDWDFFLQISQQAHFYFVPLQLFEWHVDAGDSGTGAGSNQDAKRAHLFHGRIQEKWAETRSVILEQVMPILQSANKHAQCRAWEKAEEQCRAALSISANDPWALNILAMIKRELNNLVEARVIQELAVEVCPRDAGFAYNLAVLCDKQDDLEHARYWCNRALQLDPGFQPASRLRTKLAPASWSNPR